MNDRAKPNPRLRQALIVAVCVLAVLLIFEKGATHRIF